MFPAGIFRGRGNDRCPEAFPATRGAQPGESGDWVRSVFTSPRIFTSLLIVEVCFLYLLRWPLLYNFNNFAFWDSGAYLLTHYLLQQGHHPFTYFGWQYGLLPLLIQELGFHLFGASPASFLCLSVPCVMTVAVAIGGIALLENATAGRVLVMLSLPLMVAFEPDMPHSLEPALLSLGLLSQARAQHGRALAFATAACFTKPSMGYLYGLILLACVFCYSYRRVMPVDRREQAGAVEPTEWEWPSATGPVGTLVPAVCTGLGLTLLLSMLFGWQAVLRSLLPLSGARAYRVLHYGWRGIAQGLFYFPGAKIGYYVGTPVIFWGCGTVYLIVAAFLAARASARNHFRATQNYEIVLTCAGLHLGFIALLYGSPASWTYYACVLVAGIIATEVWPVAVAAISGICVLAALANYSGIRSALSAWGTTEATASTAGLFAVSAEAAEWSYVASLAKRESLAIFTNFGEAQLLFPWLGEPTGAFMVPGIATDGEIRRENQELRSADAVVVPTIPGLGNPIQDWPGTEFNNVLENTALVFKGTYFEVYERRALY